MNALRQYTNPTGAVGREALEDESVDRLRVVVDHLKSGQNERAREIVKKLAQEARDRDAETEQERQLRHGYHWMLAVGWRYQPDLRADGLAQVAPDLDEARRTALLGLGAARAAG